MLRTYKFRLYPTKKQSGTLQWTLDRNRELYNAALQERRESYKYTGKGTMYNQQSAQLPAIKELREEYQEIYSQVLQDTLKRVEKTSFDVSKQGKLLDIPDTRAEIATIRFVIRRVASALTRARS
jgi:putative transposase